MLVMKRLSLLLFALGVFATASSQTNNITESVQLMKNDTNKVNYLNDLAWDFRKTESIGAPYAMEAYRISDSIAYQKGLAISLSRLGTIQKWQGNYSKAIEYNLQSLKIEKERENVRSMTILSMELSKAYQKNYDYEIALYYGKEALLFCGKLSDKKLLASVYGILGSVYFDLNKYDKSIESHHESIKIREIHGSRSSLIRSYLNVSAVYNVLKKEDKALEYLRIGEQLSIQPKNEVLLSKIYTNMGVSYEAKQKLDSALYFYNKSLEIKKRLDLSNKELLFNNIAVIYQERKDYEVADKFYKRSLELAQENDNKEQLLVTYYNFGNLLKKEKKLNKAVQYFKESLELSKLLNKDITRLEILMSLAEGYEGLGQFQLASLFNERHIELRDSVDQRYRQAEIVLKKLTDEKKINEILKKDNELSVVKMSKQRTVLWSMGIGIVLLISLFVISFKLYRSKKAQQLAEKNQKIEIQKNVELLRTQELKSIKAMINGQEEERKRIAQDLHDRLGSMLSMVKLHYKSVEENLDKLKKENKEQYALANSLLDEACTAVREIAHEMVSGVLTKFGLVAALEDLVRIIQGTNKFQVELITHGLDDRLDNKTEMELYGIISELINNILTHADANDISIQLIKRVDLINLTVIDDGKGFVFNTDTLDSGLGLKSIQSRVDSLEGELKIDSSIGRGTTVTIDIPLKN